MKKHFSFQWHITDQCDQRCKHCYIFSDENKKELYELPIESLKIILDNCIDMCEKIGRTPFFSLTGGDPILHENFWELISLFKEKKIPFNILGNPFHLNEEICKKLFDYGCQTYQLSIDGLKDTHDYIRKKGSFDCTLSKIPIIKKSGMKCAIMTTVSKTNINEITQIIDVVVKTKADIFAFARYCPVSSERNLIVSPIEYRNLLDACWTKFNEYASCDTSFSLKDHLWTLYLYEKGLFQIDDTLDKEMIYDGCSCGIGHLTILANGTIFACRRMDSPVGNALKDQLLDVFLSEKMDAYREYNQYNKCAKCELLRFCRGCPAVSSCLTGDMYSDDPQCWKEL